MKIVLILNELNKRNIITKHGAYDKNDKTSATRTKRPKLMSGTRLCILARAGECVSWGSKQAVEIQRLVWRCEEECRPTAAAREWPGRRTWHQHGGYKSDTRHDSTLPPSPNFCVIRVSASTKQVPLMGAGQMVDHSNTLAVQCHGLSYRMRGRTWPHTPLVQPKEIK